MRNRTGAPLAFRNPCTVPCGTLTVAEDLQRAVEDLVSLLLLGVVVDCRVAPRLERAIHLNLLAAGSGDPHLEIYPYQGVVC